MKRSLNVAVIVGMLSLLFGAFSGVAQGQDDGGPELTISGDDVTATEEGEETTYAVDAAGTYDLTITGAGFSLDVFVLQCPGAAGSLEALTEGDPTTLCDLSNLVPAVPDAEGGFEVVMEAVEVDDCGLVFAAGDAAQTESAAVLLTVTNPAADAVCEVTESEGYDESLAGTEGAEGAEGAEGELANTGVNSLELAGIAVAVLLAGWVLVAQSRRVSARRIGS